MGILLIAAYIVGHLIQGFGNAIEWFWWKAVGGLPSDWPRSGKRHLLSPKQNAALPAKIRDALNLPCPTDLSSIKPNDWSAIIYQVQAVVRKAGRAVRVDVFNGNYGMCRGVAAAILLVIVAAYNDTQSDPWRLYGVLIVAFFLSLLRMHGFGRSYARELFVEFLSVQPGEAEPKKKNATAEDEE